VEQPVTGREIDVEQTWNRRGTRGTAVGVDPGSRAGGLAVVDLVAGTVRLAWWRALSACVELHEADGEAYRVTRHGTLALALVASLRGVEATVAACEAVRPYRGRPAPVALATAAGVAVGVLEAQGVAVQRPDVSTWRAVYFGRPVALERERAKRVALDWLRGDRSPGVPLEAWQPHGLTVPAAVRNAPDHAAEALGLAVWAASNEKSNEGGKDATRNATRRNAKGPKVAEMAEIGVQRGVSEGAGGAGVPASRVLRALRPSFADPQPGNQPCKHAKEDE
jgi:Holliday junction resolvasome RuvABC endonuclease subunit